MSQTKADLLAEIRRLRSKVRALERAAEAGSHVDSALRCLLDESPVLIWTTDNELHLTSLSGAIADEFEPGPDEAVGLSLNEYFDRTDPVFLAVAAGMRALSGETLRYSIQWRDRFLAVNTGPLVVEDGVIGGTLAVGVDRTHQHEIEAQLRSTESRYGDLLRAINEIVLWYDFDGKIVFANPATQLSLGLSERDLKGRDVFDLVAAQSRAAITEGRSKLLKGITPPACEVIFTSDSGREVTTECRMSLSHNYAGEPDYIQAIAVDVSERHKVEEQIRQAQKMHSIGVLAGGVAHDFNNLLTGILGYGYMLKDETGSDDRHAEAIDVIVRSAERATQLTKQLLGFAKRGKNEDVPNDLHSIVRDVIDLLQRTIDKKVRITASLMAAQPHVLGDSTQLYQLLLNLCLNARDAMAEGGEIRIQTKNSGSSVLLSVQDTGPGISDHVREHMFEPFFTTKAASKGMGMGLAMVYGIAKNHGGTVHVDTELGVGSTFHVLLPVCDARGSAERARIKAIGGRGRILVIDDEPMVRQVVARMLCNLGYDVETAGDSVQAVGYYAEHHQSIDAVILDMVMPKMSGRECLEALRSINPDVRAVISSGAERHLDAQFLIESGNVEYLQKPYQPHDLARVVRRAMLRETAQNA